MVREVFSFVKVELEISFILMLSAPHKLILRLDAASYRFTFIFPNITEAYFLGFMSFLWSRI